MLRNILSILLFAGSAGVFAGAITAAPAEGPPPRQLFFQSDKTVWWGTQSGLNRFQTENELWSNVRPDAITDLCLDEQVLWTGTEHGVFFADLRYLDWKTYGAKQGLSSDTVVRIVSDLDYVYAAGPHGLARMSKLVEQWEPMGDFSGKRIYDLYSNQTQLWVATDAGVFYFDKKFEKWESYNASTGLISNTVYRIFYFGDFLWALTDKGFSRYSSGMKSWNSYKLGNGIVGSSVRYMLVDASYIWIASPEGVARFSAKNQTWENFSRSTPLEKKTVNAISTSGTNSWFATSDGVFFFAEDQRRWKTYTSVDGLSDDVQEEIYATGQTTICRKDLSFSYWHPTEDLWFSSTVKVAAGGGKAKWKPHLDESGLGAVAPSGQSINLLGRAYTNLINSADFPAPIDKSIGNYLTNKNLDSLAIRSTTDSVTGNPKFDTTLISRYHDQLYNITKAQLNLNADLGSGRTFRGSYDNTDPLGDLRYAAEYKGFGDDILKRAGWRTDQKTDYFFSSLIDPTYLEGAGIRTEFGDRVGDKKLRRVNTGLWAGWRKTRYLDTLVAFNEDNFYDLGVPNITTESVVIRIDGQPVDPKDYSLERTLGLLTFRNEGIANPDSRIEITCQYQPRIGEFTNEMAAAENVVAINDKVSLGVNGLYRGIKEPGASGAGLDTNRAFAGSVNGKIEAKSKDGRMYLRAIPELSGSYNDSVLVSKQGSAAKLGLYSVLHNLRLNAAGLFQEPDYITLADQQSIYGRVNRSVSGEAVYDLWQQYMPVTLGGAYTDASRGNENREYLQYLLSPPSLPSVRLFGMHEGMVNRTRFARARLAGQDTVPSDSLTSERLNGVIETEWGKSFKHFDRLWFNASYTVNLLTDTLDTTVAAGALPGTYSLMSTFDQRFNQNIFAWVRLSPISKLQLEIKYVHRIFMDRDSMSSPFAFRGSRIRPEFKLFSQELVPGITLYGDYLLQTTDNIISPDSTATSLSHSLNASTLVVPGIYWSFFNPFQLSLGYNLLTRDSLNNSGLTTGGSTITDTMKNSVAQTFSFKPMFDFTEDLHFDSRTDISESRNFSLLTENGVKIYNSARLAFRERKTRFDVDFNIFTDNQYLRDSTLVDTSFVESRTLELRAKWTERWTPDFRTELDFVGSNQNSAFSWFDALANPLRDSSTGYLNTFTPGILFDWRVQGKWIREFRVQYYIGALLADGNSLDWSTYDKAEQNKLDIQIKAGANFFLRLLLNIDYYFDQKMLKYDMAELKATALF
jgi:frataxin-like iron-binding protein CyaY